MKQRLEFEVMPISVDINTGTCGYYRDRNVVTKIEVFGEGIVGNLTFSKSPEINNIVAPYGVLTCAARIKLTLENMEKENHASYLLESAAVNIRNNNTKLAIEKITAVLQNLAKK